MVEIALSVKIESQEQAQPAIREAVAKNPDLVELRLDYMPAEMLDEKTIDMVLECCGKPAIVTIRYESEAGPDEKAGYKGEESRRRELYTHAIDRGAAYVDIEALRIWDFDRKDTKVIGSHHNFEYVPENLINIYKAFRTILFPDGVNILKFALKTTEGSCQKIEELIELANEEKIPIIGIGMGEEGARTRLNPGNYLTYACLEKGEGTAPGQYTVAEMRRLLG